MSHRIDGLDGERTARQALFFDLEDSGAILGWSALELTHIAKRIGDAGNTNDAAALLSIGKLLKAEQQKLSAYADEVKRDRIARSGVE
jgi:hypothetical protein